MHSRLFLIWSLVTVACASISTHAAERPNILFISVDDLKPILGCYGSAEVPTPKIDKLAARGTVFLNAYCQQAICAPSRMSTFTGLRPDSTRVWDLRTSIQEANPDAVTMQQWFKEHGYTSAGGGKTMHGARANHPESWSMPHMDQGKLTFAEGFPRPAHDNAFYQNEKSHEVYAELQASNIKQWKERFDYLRERDAMPSTESLDVPDDAYVDGALTNWAMGLLDRFAQSKEPFFLTVGYCKPHLPFAAPKKYWDMFDRDEIELASFRKRAKDSPDFAYHQFGELRSYTDIPSGFNNPIPEEKQRELIHGYYACVAYIDAQIGKLVEKLDETGLAENTIVVIWGDHGYHLGDHGMWNKHSNFEQATRSPLIIIAPGKTPNQKAATMAEFVDIFPTLVELAELEEPYALEGESLVPALEDGSAEVKPYAISQYPRGGNRMGYALRDSRYRLVMWMKDGWRTTKPYNPGVLETIELYDYAKDPDETVNLATDPRYAQIVSQLTASMLAYFKEHEETPAVAKAAAPSTPASPPMESAAFIDLATINPADIETRFATVRKTGEGLKISYQLSPKWPSIDFLPPTGTTWNLSRYGAVDITLSNLGTQAVKTTAFITNPGDNSSNRMRNGTTQVIGAGKTETITIKFDPSHYPLDLTRLASLRIFVDKLKAPATFLVRSIKASGTPPAETATPPAKALPAASSTAAAVGGASHRPAADGSLVNLADTAALVTDLRFSQVKPDAAGNGLILDFEVSPKWPSVEFFAGKNATWDLSGYSAIDVKLTNVGGTTERIFVYAANPHADYRQKKKRSAEKFDLSPSQTHTFRISLSQAGGFNPSQVEAVRIFTGMHKTPVTLKLSSIKAVR